MPFEGYVILLVSCLERSICLQKLSLSGYVVSDTFFAGFRLVSFYFVVLVPEFLSCIAPYLLIETKLIYVLEILHCYITSNESDNTVVQVFL